MPLRTNKRTSTAYESDNGFVAGSDDEDNAPRPKKVKAEKGADKKAVTAKKAKADKGEGTAVVGGGMKDGNGDEFWEISNNRRLVITTYNKKLMVNIREYYEKDGESLPGKKGISLPIAQLATIISLLPHLETVLQSKGETLPRPDYGKLDVAHGLDGNDDSDTEEDDEEDEGDDGTGDRESVEVERKRGERAGGKGKQNFEATSEEDL